MIFYILWKSKLQYNIYYYDDMNYEKVTKTAKIRNDSISIWKYYLTKLMIESGIERYNYLTNMVVSKKKIIKKNICVNK